MSRTAPASHACSSAIIAGIGAVRVRLDHHVAPLDPPRVLAQVALASCEGEAVGKSPPAAGYGLA